MMPSFASWNYSKVRIDFATTPNPLYSKWYICVPNEDDTTVYQNVKPAENAVGHQHLHIEFQNRDLPTPNPLYSKWYICVPNEDDTTVYQNVKPAENAVGHQHLHIEFQNRDLPTWSRHSSPAIDVGYSPHGAPILRTSNTGAHICVLIVVLTRKHSERRDSWKPLATNSTGTWRRCSRAV